MQRSVPLKGVGDRRKQGKLIPVQKAAGALIPGNRDLDTPHRTI
jgi:hypothetical protein